MGKSAVSWPPPCPPTEEVDPVQYFSGLDLGPPSEFTALAVLARTIFPDPERKGGRLTCCAVRHLERFELRAFFPECCGRAKKVFSAWRLQDSTVTVDQTVGGQPVMKLLHRARIGVSIRPITITAGQQSEYDQHGTCLVP